MGSPGTDAAKQAAMQGSNAMSDETRAPTGRRDFLRLAAAGAPAAALAAMAAPAAAAEKPEEITETGLRLTEHTRKYYDSARF